jgi:Uma2 family endonuclease
MNEPSTVGNEVPLLEEGQRLDRIEFERRYEAMPHVKKAELIEGVVYMPPPVNLDNHGEPHILLSTWIGVYWGSTPGLRVGDNSTVRLDMENEPQPDVLLMIRPECGGQARIEGGYVVDAPELAAEVSASRIAVDRGPRLRTYQAHGVQEYIIWSVEDGVVEWFVLRGQTYDHLRPAAGIVRSETFPGLWLDVAALLRFDLPQLLAVLQQGLASPEHQAFVAELQRRRTAP